MGAGGGAALEPPRVDWHLQMQGGHGDRCVDPWHSASSVCVRVGGWGGGICCQQVKGQGGHADYCGSNSSRC